MPELPEVETVKNQLAASLLNQTILSLSLSGKKMRYNPQASKIKIIDQETIQALHRRNKYLLIETNHLWLVFHLGMSGQLLIKDKNQAKAKHEHITLEFQNFNLSLVDPRRFGGFAIFDKKEFPNSDDIALFKTIGIEHLGPEYTLVALKTLLKDNNQHMKQFLLDAGNICGIGNIYASEILFRSKILPTRLGKSLTAIERKRVFEQIKEVLELAIAQGGSTISDFKHVNGQSGNMQNLYKVYNREGEPCRVCKTPIQRIIQNARSTYFCPHCQK